MAKDILFHSNNISEHLIGQIYSDYDSFHLKGNVNLDHLLVSNYDNNNHFHNNLEYLVPLSIVDRNILQQIMNSKLLFSEDYSHIEMLLSNSYCYTNKSFNFVISGIIVGGISSVLLFKKWINISTCVPLTAITSYLFHLLYRHYYVKASDSQFLDKYIKVLQNICSTAHKVLRYVKEIQVISTGQVSSYNICAATYLNPTNTNSKELNELPHWKTLPHTRKCLAGALVDLIQLFSVMLPNIQANVPFWMKDYTFSIEFNVEYITKYFNEINQSEDCFSIKYLQTLLETYLVVQSEFLRLLAFSMCPIYGESYHLNSKSKNYIFKILKESESKLLDIYSEINEHYNRETKFQNAIVTQNQLSNDNLKDRASFDIKDSGIVINTLQVKIHSIFVLLTSLVAKSKKFEDQIEDIINFSNTTNVDIVKNCVAEQVYSFKEDFRNVMESYVGICNEIAVKLNKKYNDSMDNTNGTSNEDNIQHVQKLSQSSNEHVLSYSSTDDIFISISGQRLYNNECHIDDWSSQILPIVPKSMLTELSSTLEPIKVNFRKREKLALERQGLQDIESDGETDEKCTGEPIVNNDKHNNEHVDNNCSDNLRSLPDCMDVASKTMDEDSYPPIYSSSSLACIAAKKSLLWNTSHEEHFSDS